MLTYLHYTDSHCGGSTLIGNSGVYVITIYIYASLKYTSDLLYYTIVNIVCFVLQVTVYL